MIGSLVVLAKCPVPGRVKTRLIPPLSPEQAATLAAAAFKTTLQVIDHTPARERLLAFDAPPLGWLLAGWRACRQPDGGLDQRIVAAFRAAGAGPVLLVGMDTPQLRAEQLTAFDPGRYDACLGMATDGGYWAIGLREPRLAQAAIRDVPMSTPHTGHEQLNRLQRLGLRVQLLDELRDVDTFADARAVASLMPDTDFSHAVTRADTSLGRRVG